MNVFLPRKSIAGISFSLPSKCQKHLAKMCDIRTMISRALAGDTSVYSKGSYSDVTNVPDSMQDLLNLATKGREAYDSLPDSVKSVYPSPEVFISALYNKDEKQRLLSLGVFAKKPVDAPVEVRVINPVNEGTNPEAHADT